MRGVRADRQAIFLKQEAVVRDKLSVSLPELGLFGATRGMIGAGIGLLLANRMSNKRRKAVGLPLFIVGALSTIPIAMHIFHKDKPAIES
jgi:presenilin-like A22 family membrane protease